MMKKNQRGIGWSRGMAAALRCLVFGWLAAALVEYLCLPSGLRSLSDTAGLSAMSAGRVAALSLLIAAGLMLVSRLFRLTDACRWGILGLFSLLSSVALCQAREVGLLIACSVLLTVLAVYAVRGWQGGEEVRPAGRAHPVWGWLTLCAAVLFLIGIGACTVAKVRAFATPTYDFGLFSQMFHSMKEHGIPMTTLERDRALSHFAVHVSPMYYVMLPVYCLAPCPETLQLLQVAVLMSAVLPMWGLGRQIGLCGAERFLLCLLLLLYPTLAGGTYYDLHENCFLMPLLLWLFWGIERRNTPMVLLSAVLTLGVKEDAAVYVAVIGLWLAIRAVLRRRGGRQVLLGVGLLALSVGYFLWVTAYLREAGDGVMTGRYQNLMWGESASLWCVIGAAFCHPMKVLCECFETEKLHYAVLTMLPLLGLPLLTRRYERYLLLIPYLLVNLMTDYVYQYDIFFQYSFGSGACLLYLAAVNLADLRRSPERLAGLAAAVALSAACFGGLVLPRLSPYLLRSAESRAANAEVRQVLETIPDDASVAATTFYTTPLSMRDVVYDVGYCTREHLLDVDYVVVHPEATGDFGHHVSDDGERYPAFCRLLAEHGFEQVGRVDGLVTVFQKIK